MEHYLEVYETRVAQISSVKLPWRLNVGQWHLIVVSPWCETSFNVALTTFCNFEIECVWNLMAHCDAQGGKWRGNWRIEWVASTLHTTSERGVSSITTADAYTSAASSWLNWRPRRFKWTRLFRRKTKSDFCACAITFQKQSSCLILWKKKLSISDVRYGGAECSYCLGHESDMIWLWLSAFWSH